MLGAVLLGLVAGVIARMLTPGDVFRNMSGPASWLASIALGLAGAILGYLIFTVGLGIGDTDIFDWGGIISAIIGTVIVLVIVGFFVRRRGTTRRCSHRRSRGYVRRRIGEISQLVDACPAIGGLRGSPASRDRAGRPGGRRKPMKVRAVLRGVVIATILAMLGALLPQLASAAPKKALRPLPGRRQVVGRLRRPAGQGRQGGRARPARPAAGQDDGGQRLGVGAQQPGRRPADPWGRQGPGAPDRPPSGARPTWPLPACAAPPRLKAKAPAATTAAGINPDPAFDYKGLLWDYRRIGLPQGWKTTAGSSAVTVGVADTGLDFTHRELSSKVKQVVDFTGTEDPPICKTFFGVVRRGPGGPVRRAGDHRLERPRLLDRRPHRRRPQRHRHQRDRAQGQPGRPEDLPVVRLGLRLRDPGRRS